MAIDASIAAGQAPASLLQTLAGASALKGQQLQQQQAIQQQQANVAVSAAYKQATDPTTGKVDFGALQAALAGGPAAYNLPQIMNQLQQTRNADQQFDQGQLDMAIKRNTALANGLGGLISTNNLTPQGLMSVGVNAMKTGVASVDQVKDFLSGAPTDPKQLAAWIQQQHVAAGNNIEAMQAYQPRTQVLDNGAYQNIVSIDPRTGQPVQGGQSTVIQNQMAPGDAQSPIQVFNPATGTMEFSTKAQVAAAAQGQPQAGMAPQQGMGGNGRYPTAPQQGAAPQGAGQMGLQAGPALGAAAAAETAAKGSAEGALSLQQQAEQSPQRVYFLQDMARNLKNFDSGPTADWTNKAQALALQLAPGVAMKVGIDPQSVASKEEFQKFATNLAINTSAGLGAGTDSKLAAAVAGNPNASLSGLGNDQIIKVLIGTERATQAKNLAWQQSGKGAENYGKWSADYNKTFDPRVFVAPELSQEERAKMFEGLSPKDQESFKQSYNAAVRSGIIQRPGG